LRREFWVVIRRIFTFKSLLKGGDASAEGITELWEPAMAEKQNDKSDDNQVT